MSSGIGVVNVRRRAAWTLTQLLAAIVAKSRSPSPETVRVRGPRPIVPSGSPVRVTTRGRAARRNGAARNAERAVAKAGRRAASEPPTIASQARPMARKAPLGRRLTATMKPTARTILPRASARWIELGLGT
jgi:hypothetical protein